MWLLGFLILFQGSLSTANGLDLMLQTLKCSRLRVNIEPHKNLMDSPEKLDAMCKQQELFYRCLENMVQSLDIAGNLVLPFWLLNERLLTHELCSEGSAWRKRYLDSASCINKQQMDFCTSSDFLIAMSNNVVPLNRCRLREKAVNCIAVTLAMNCGIDAGNVFHYLLKMVADDDSNCESVGSDVISSCIGPATNNTGYKVFEIYNELLNRVGNIPEQEDTNDIVSDSLKRMEDSEIESDQSAIDDVTGATENLNFEWSDQRDSEREDVEFATKEKSLNRNKLEYISQYETNVISQHPDGSISFYWKQSGFIPIESITCNHVSWKGEDAFKCSIKRRFENPDCQRSKSEECSINAKEIDPELGVELDGIQSKFSKQDSVLSKFECTSKDCNKTMEKSKYDADQNEFDYKTPYEQAVEDLFVELSTINTDVPVNSDSISDGTLEYMKSGREPIIDLSSKLIVSNESVPELVKIQSTIDGAENFETKSDLDETLSDVTSESSILQEDSINSNGDFLFQTDFIMLNELFDAIASADSESKPNTFPKQIKDEMQSMFSFESNPDVLHTTDGVTFVWSEKGQSPIEGIVCERIDKCDPSVEDIFKCLITPRNKELSLSQASLPSDEGKDGIEQSETKTKSNLEYQSLPEESKYLESSEDSTLVLVTEDGTLLNVDELLQDPLIQLQSEGQEIENVYIHMDLPVDTEPDTGISTEGYQIVVDQMVEPNLKEETGYNEMALDSDSKIDHEDIQTSYQSHSTNKEIEPELVTVEKIFEKYIDAHLAGTETSEE